MPTFTPTPVPDTEPPVISGVEPIKVKAGDTVSYNKGVSVTDDSGEEIVLVVDNSDVDLSKPGEYTVIYSATDSAGNMSIQEAVVTVIPKDPYQKEQEADRLAEELIKKIITPDMDEWTKIYTIWDWCRKMIACTYTEGDMTSEYTGAYEGLHDRAGDSWTYYSTMKVLLDKAGIPNEKCFRVGGDPDHYWNLVLYDGKYYHCDSSPLPEDGTYWPFLQTDDQVIAYMRSNRKHPDYYNCDFTTEPKRSEFPVYDGWTHTALEFGKSITKAYFDSKITELKEAYPDGKYWNGGDEKISDTPCSNNGGYDRCNFHMSPIRLLFRRNDMGYQCFGFAAMLSDAIFGNSTSAYVVNGFENVLPGDVIRIEYDNGKGHAAFVIEKYEDHVVVAECNADFETCKIEWGRSVTREELERDNAFYLRRTCSVTP
ncbi:MAG: DUF5011 domain-containing protein [Lachnospiraceae bacterium]|nr:DUF5011 domain-containing protein [Lachnospiraceae bacterium]